MELNEIKKALYRENPKAYFKRANSESLVYEAIIDDFEAITKICFLTFIVPIEEIGDATFETEMPAKLLIRYIVK